MDQRETILRCATASSLWDWLSIWWGVRKIKFADWMISKGDALRVWGTKVGPEK